MGRSSLRRYAPLVGAIVIALGAAAGAGAEPIATAAQNCSIPSGGEGLGPTYLTALSVSGAPCSTGLSVVRAYHACQVKHGGLKGTCPSTVDGFRCKETRGPAVATEFYSSVSCSAHSKRVVYKYAQFT